MGSPVLSSPLGAGPGAVAVLIFKLGDNLDLVARDALFRPAKIEVVSVTQFPGFGNLVYHVRGVVPIAYQGAGKLAAPVSANHVHFDMERPLPMDAVTAACIEKRAKADALRIAVPGAVEVQPWSLIVKAPHTAHDLAVLP